MAATAAAKKVDKDRTALEDIDKGDAVQIESEDHIDEFDKRVERLTTIAEEADFESGSLLGDVRDTLLEIFRHRPKAWSQMSEAEQRDLAKALENSAKMLVRKVVVVVAEQDEIAVAAVLKGYSAKGGTFKLNAEARGDQETALQLFDMDGHDVVIMSADASRFLGNAKDAAIEPDQPEMSLEPPENGEQEPAEDGEASEGVEGTEAESD